MTRGFYDQLGVDPDASPEEIRTAYHRLVTQFNRRRAALLERGGDPDRLALARHQADEAFAVLRHPARRRRYDAFLSLHDRGLPQGDGPLWDAVSGAVVPERVASALALLDRTTALAVGTIAPPPSLVRTPSPEPQPLRSVSTSAVTAGSASVVTLSTGTASLDDDPSAGPDLRVVDGASGGAPVIMMPRPGPQLRAVQTVPSVSAPRPSLRGRLGCTGSLLAAVREGRSLSIDDVGEQTRIAVRFLRAIEEETFERLPSSTFVRGYVRELAVLYDLDEDDMVEGYMERFHDKR